MLAGLRVVIFHVSRHGGHAIAAEIEIEPLGHFEGDRDKRVIAQAGWRLGDAVQVGHEAFASVAVDVGRSIA